MIPPTSTTISGRYANILLVIDHGTTPDTVASASALARRHNARLTALSIVEPPTDRLALAGALHTAPDRVLGHLVDERRSQVAALLAEARTQGPVSVEVGTGKPFQEAIHFVLRNGIDLVIKTAESLSGVQRFLFASTDHHLLRKCPCPVWLQMPQARPAPKVILAAVDVDEWDAAEPETLRDLNNQVLNTALNLAPGPDTVIYVLHAWDAVGEGMIWAFSSAGDARAAAETYTNRVLVAREEALARLVSPYTERAAAGQIPRILPRLARGSADAVIAQEAENLNIDVLVLGTVARTGIAGVIIGNTAEDILNRVDRSVVAVKPRSFTSPFET